MTKREILIAKILRLIHDNPMGYWGAADVQCTLNEDGVDSIFDILAALAEYGFLECMTPERPPNMRMYVIQRVNENI